MPIASGNKYYDGFAVFESFLTEHNLSNIDDGMSIIFRSFDWSVSQLFTMPLYESMFSPAVCKRDLHMCAAIDGTVASPSPTSEGVSRRLENEKFFPNCPLSQFCFVCRNVSSRAHNQ